MRSSRNPGPWVMGGGDDGDSHQVQDSWSSSFLNIRRIILHFEHSSNALHINRLKKRCVPMWFFAFFAFLLSGPDHVHEVPGPKTDTLFSVLSRTTCGPSVPRCHRGPTSGDVVMHSVGGSGRSPLVGPRRHRGTLGPQVVTRKTRKT